MENERWRRMQELFHAAADLPAVEQAAFLADACRDDRALRDEVESLLRHDARHFGLIDRDLANVAGDLLPSSAELPVPSHAFGAYRASRLLGEGGMGVVYLARRADLGSVAAVKILRDASLSPARRERFLAEQRTLAQLNHPGIARLYDAGTLPDGTPWIAMEHVEGSAIHDHCRLTRAPLRERLSLVRAVGEAVLHAHQHLVIHRDIKPSNVLVTSDGAAKLLDFGIAKQLQADDDEGARTRTGLRLMTPAYAAPEQLLGCAVGIQTDVYSLGVLLYELLTGTLPYDLSSTTPARAEAILSEEEPMRPSARARRSGAPVVATAAQWDDLDVLCLTAMHKDPGRRYRSVDAFLRDIDHFLAAEPLDAHADSFGYRAAAFVRRNKRAVAGTSAMMVAVVAMVTFYTVRLAQARDEALTESVRAERIQRFVTKLFRGGDEAAGPADSLRVVTLLEQGVAEARTLDREPAVQADLYQTLGSIYRQLGQLDRADTLLGTAVRQWGRVRGEQSPDAARARVALGDLRTDQARYDEGERLLSEALSTLARSHAAEGPAAVEARVALGRLLTERGEYARAMAALDSVLVSLRARGGESIELLDALGEFASANFYAGNYDRADSVNRQVLAMTQRLLGDRHPRVSEDLMNLGATEQERGNYRESERYFRDALARTIAFHGENHHSTAGNLVYLGRSLLFQGRYPEAQEAFTRSLAIRERVFGPMHPSVANTLNELGNLAIRQSRYDEGEKIFSRVLAIYRRAYPGWSYRTGVASANLADTYLYRNDFRRAEPLYRDAIAHYVASQGPEHLNTGIGHIKLGRCLLRRGRFREAIPETERGYAIVSKITAPDVSYLQAARLDLSIAFDSLGQPSRGAAYRAEREKYLPKP